MFGAIVVWAILAAIPAAIARGKGRSFIGWFLFCGFFPFGMFIGWIAALCIAPRQQAAAAPQIVYMVQAQPVIQAAPAQIAPSRDSVGWFLS